MNIQKVINTRTLLIPSLFLNVVLLAATAYFGKQYRDLDLELSRGSRFAAIGPKIAQEGPKAREAIGVIDVMLDDVESKVVETAEAPNGNRQ